MLRLLLCLDKAQRGEGDGGETKGGGKAANRGGKTKRRSNGGHLGFKMLSSTKRNQGFLEKVTPGLEHSSDKIPGTFCCTIK